MNHQKYNANYALAHQTDGDSISFIPNMQPKLIGVDYYIKNDGAQLYSEKKNENECNMRPLKEKDIIEAYRRTVEQLSGDMSEIVDSVKNNIAQELKIDVNEDLGQIEQQILIEQNHILDCSKGKEITPYCTPNMKEIT